MKIQIKCEGFFSHFFFIAQLRSAFLSFENFVNPKRKKCRKNIFSIRLSAEHCWVIEKLCTKQFVNPFFLCCLSNMGWGNNKESFQIKCAHPFFFIIFQRSSSWRINVSSPYHEQKANEPSIFIFISRFLTLLCLCCLLVKWFRFVYGKTDKKKSF